MFPASVIAEPPIVLPPLIVQSEFPGNELSPDMSTIPVPDPPELPEVPNLADLLADLPDFLPPEMDLLYEGFTEAVEVPEEISLPAEIISITAVKPLGMKMRDVKEDVLIFSLSPDLVKEAEGKFLVQVSAFTPIRSVWINGKEQPAPPKAYQAQFEVDYLLTPGENFFAVQAITESGESEQEFIVFYETKDIKRDAKKVKPFVLITILGAADDDNTNNVPDGTGKTRSTKSNFIFVPAFNQKITYFSTLSVKGLIVGDQQHQSEFKSREFLLKQLTLEWKTRKTFLGDVTWGIGANQLSTRDPNQTSGFRDSWTDEYKQSGSDTFANLGFKFGADKGTKWNVKLDHKLKSAPDNPESKGTADSFKIGAKTRFGKLKTGFQLSRTTTDLQDDSKDKSTVKGSAKLNVPLKPLMLSLQTQLSETTNRIADATTGITTKTRKTTYTAGISYPVSNWLIFAYSRKLEKQTSNLENSDYQKNINNLQMTLIF